MDRLACIDAAGGEPPDLPRRLARFSPGVEPLPGAPGTCWVDPRGLVPLWPSLAAWAREVHDHLAARHGRVAVVVGFTRLGTLAIARDGRGVRILDDPGAEQRLARRVPLPRLLLPPATLEQLDRLGIRTVGDLLSLPPGGIRERWGEPLHRLRLLAGGELEIPFSPAPPPREFRRELDLDPPERDAGRLLHRIASLLDPLLDELAAAGLAAAGLVLTLRPDGGAPGTGVDQATRWNERTCPERPPGAGKRRNLPGIPGLPGRAGPRSRRTSRVLRAARPGLDRRRLLELVRLRLEADPPGGPVAGISLELLPAPAEEEQPSLFAVARGRDLAAAERALDRVRAALGEAAVVRARLADGHLPEASFLWVPLDRLRPPRPPAGTERTLVRRLLDTPAPLPAFPRLPRPGRGPWLPGAGEGVLTLLAGPHVLSGGWWDRPFHREYGWACTPRGDLLWVFRDRACRRFYLAGRLE